MKKVTFECPEQLHAQLRELVREGWEDSEQAAILEALRRYLRVRKPETLAHQLKHDVEWGLHGKR